MNLLISGYLVCIKSIKSILSISRVLSSRSCDCDINNNSNFDLRFCSHGIIPYRCFLYFGIVLFMGARSNFRGGQIMGLVTKVPQQGPVMEPLWGSLWWQYLEADNKL